MDTTAAYKDFTARLKLFVAKHPSLIATTLSNIFTMRLIGNDLYNDFAASAIAELVNQYLDDFHAIHVGKDFFRVKLHEEGIRVVNESTQVAFPMRVKAYRDGPLRLAIHEATAMFARLQQEPSSIEHPDQIKNVFDDPAFAAFGTNDILPIIYDEQQYRCNIMVFDRARARQATAHIALVTPGKGRKYPAYVFYDAPGCSICEVHYGTATANALHRGLWADTKQGVRYFDSLTGWISYAYNPILVSLFSEALVSSEAGHTSALEKIKEDIVSLKAREELPR